MDRHSLLSLINSTVLILGLSLIFVQFDKLIASKLRSLASKPHLTQLSQLGGETTIFKKLFPHSVSLFPKTLSNLAW